MAIAIDQVDFATAEKFPAESVLPPPDSAPRPQIGKPSRNKWAKWALAIGIVAVLGMSVELWRMHTQNAVGYDTVAVERGLISCGTLIPAVEVRKCQTKSGSKHSKTAEK